MQKEEEIMEKYLPIVNRKHCRKIWLSDILYIMQEGRLTHVVTENETFSTYNKIGFFGEYLDSRFYYCLKSIAINFQQVSMMQNQTIFFKNGDNIFLGRQNYIHTRQSFANYIKNPCNSNDSVV